MVEQPASGHEKIRRGCVTRLNGRVSFDGISVPDVAISVDTGEAISLDTYTDSNGLFSLTAGPRKFRLLAEAPGFHTWVSDEVVPFPCRTVELSIVLTPESNTARGPTGESANVLTGLFETFDSSQTATVVIRLGDSLHRTQVETASFTVRLPSEPPYRVYFEGADWVTDVVELSDLRARVHIKNDFRLPKTFAEELGTVWRFSSPAGVFFMEQEASVTEFEKCVSAGVCRSRKEPEEIEDFPPCDLTEVGPADCVTQRNAEIFCGHLGGRLPTREEWAAEYTDSGRRNYPWGSVAPNCERANVAVRMDDSQFPIPPYVAIVHCAGTRKALGCSYPLGKSVSGLCDMSGNLGEWISMPGCALGVPFRSVIDLQPNCGLRRNGAIGVRCVRDLKLREHWEL